MFSLVGAGDGFETDHGLTVPDWLERSVESEQLATAWVTIHEQFVVAGSLLTRRYVAYFPAGRGQPEGGGVPQTREPAARWRWRRCGERTATHTNDLCVSRKGILGSSSRREPSLVLRKQGSEGEKRCVLLEAPLHLTQCRPPLHSESMSA